MQDMAQILRNVQWLLLRLKDSTNVTTLHNTIGHWA